ncbi:bifunctional adenosylcobinamide kinase/adenosylcobinamide-phosphate guanylyltransferase [Vreelandella zhaodongensis]|uniref:Adenosylcobinamide kinase n=1 Tax=Vreelandella zhaodongensis TaxID=1176240 RepID=A0ABX2SVH2_VREZH|nr:bifunctional adenosylcobinamide kinase/adenosylcobinamide-phosphate guanylyltransferase [Halomonas zhaodongensis]NYS45565.1 bifunctional adenosylcobinamide kinase/adenosylcobinamide-phosphate guanylyltransferase [Halomonas zhaodongensis]
MQLFIGGACAGKRDAVKARFPSAVWWRLSPGQRLHEATHIMQPSVPLVLHGVFEWLAAVQSLDISSDVLRAQWRGDLESLESAAQTHEVTLVIIMNELGRGIVPMARDQRRLRDLSGWFSQDTASQSEQVWHVRHGLVQAVK